MTHHNPNACYRDSHSDASPLQQVLGLIEQAMKWINDAYDVSTQRRHLTSLSTEALDDIGLTRKEAAREATRSFWDMP
ncbi:MAG: DUF1127 domain-containing protein [Sphingomonadales bacterium]|nr:DUF1127 domain-containing protein [Sphingomonadales bacterium]